MDAKVILILGENISNFGLKDLIKHSLGIMSTVLKIFDGEFCDQRSKVLESEEYLIYEFLDGSLQK